tara:strand:+ start:2898 stop:4604 length:1707 start_codon:yes stop_codon:yes gene_type:complete
MVDMYTPKPSSSTRHLNNYFSTTPVSTGEVLGEEFRSAARFGVDALRSIGGAVARGFSGEELLTLQEYRNSEFFREGIEVGPQGIKISAAKDLAESYDRRFSRDLVLSRARNTIGTSTARLGASLMGSILDPINIGLAFAAPFAIGATVTGRIAAAKVASGLTARYGTGTARFGVGAAEGAIGAAAFEPLALLGSKIQQDPNYGLFDSFVNLTAGGILGGGIATVGGRIGDALRRANPQTVNQAMRVSVGQAIEGKTIDPTPVYKADPVMRGLDADNVVNYKPEAVGEKIRTLAITKEEPDKLPPALRPAQKKPTTNITNFIKQNGKLDTKSINTAEVGAELDNALFTAQKKGGKNIDDMILLLQDEGFFPHKIDSYNDRATIDDLTDALRKDAMSNQNYYSINDAKAEAYKESLELTDRVYDLNIEPMGMTDGELFDAIQTREGALTQSEAFDLDRTKGDGFTQQELDDEIQRIYSAKEDYGDLEEFLTELEEMELEAKIFARQKQADIDPEIFTLQAEVDAMASQGMIPQSFLNDIAEADGYVSKAEVYEQVTNAGATCMVGKFRP